eukprot:815102-Prorocentrum_minimum.AAC.1
MRAAEGGFSRQLAAYEGLARHDTPPCAVVKVYATGPPCWTATVGGGAAESAARGAMAVPFK